MRKPTTRQFFWISVALQALFLVAMIATNRFTLLTGKEIFLRTAPVDPRSLFQGDYVILSYAISRIDLSSVAVSPSDLGSIKQGQTVYVSLAAEPGQKYSSAKGVSLSKPAAGDFIKGKIRYVDYYQGNVDCLPGRDCILKNGGKPTSISVTYGIESYFVPEGQGRQLERVNRRGGTPLIIGVSVDRTGRGLIKSLVIDETLIDAGDINQVVEVASTTVNTYDSQRQRIEGDSELTSLMRDISEALQEYRNKNYVYPAKPQGLPPYDELAKLATEDNARFRYLKSRADNRKGVIVWLDNSNYADGYCVFAQSVRDPLIWYVIDSNDAIIDAPRELNRQPLSLSDCGVAVKQPLATVEGYIFIDNNGDKTFDAGDRPFVDAEIYLNKLFDDGNGWQKMVRPGSDGHFKFSVYDEGSFGLGASSKLDTPVNINYSKTNTIVVNQGDASTHNNILISF